MSTPRYIVWLRMTERTLRQEGEKPERIEQLLVDGPYWSEQGDGPLPHKTAERIAREITEDFGTRTKVLPVGSQPTTS